MVINIDGDLLVAIYVASLLHWCIPYVKGTNLKAGHNSLRVPLTSYVLWVRGGLPVWWLSVR